MSKVVPNQQSIELDGGVSVNINRVVNRPFAGWAADVELIGLGIAFSGEYCGRVEGSDGRGECAVLKARCNRVR